MDVTATAPSARFALPVVASVVAVSVVAFAARVLELEAWFFGVAVGSAAVAVVAGISRNKPARVAPWGCVAAALAIYLCSFIARQADSAGAVGSIALGDVFRIIGYVVMTVGLSWWIVARRSRPDVIPLIDGVLIALGVLLVTWVLFLSPILAVDGTPGPTMPAGLYPAFDAGMLTLSVYLIVASRGANVSVRWMTVAFAAFLVGDMAYAVSLGSGPHAPAWLYDVAFGLGLVSFAAAALDRSMAGVADLPLVNPLRSTGRGVLLLILLAACVFVPLLVTARTQPDLVFRSLLLTVVVLATFLRGDRALRRAQESEERALYDAAHDSLTGLPNRDALAQHVVRGEVTVLFVDLDNFKIVNDSYGHVVVADLIAAVAERIRSTVDAAHIVVRYSGDEFVVVADLTRSASEMLARNIIESLVRPFTLGRITVYVTATVGIARGSVDPGGLADVIREADTAMYHAKSFGAGSMSYFDESLRRSAMRELDIATALRGAVARGEFEVYYQPIVAAGSRNIVVYEALLRWHHDGVVVAPSEFVPVAESTNLIGEIGEWVLDTAIRDIARLRAGGRPDVTMSVNVSALQLRDAHLPDLVRDLLREHGVDGSVLSLEVTESMLIDDTDAANSLLRRLADQGILIVLDDFGMGYSSLSRLQHMPIAVLKIDKSFVGELGKDPSALSLLTAITSMADALSIYTVAEGVETEEQMAAITEVGCRFAQGYLFGRPAPLAEWLSDPSETPAVVAER